ncbi:MAG: hypothetical protein QW299_08980 [Candidatus Caldarchaeum sp.]
MQYQPNDTQDIIQIFESRINDRSSHIERMRRIAMRQRARVTLDVLTALYVGRIDISTLPNIPAADRLMTILVRNHLQPFIQTAVEDLLICGAGGIAITMIGIGQLRPENWVVYPSFKNPRLSVRKFSISPYQACLFFGVDPFRELLLPIFEELERIEDLKLEEIKESFKEKQEKEGNEPIEWDEDRFNLEVASQIDPLIFELMPPVEIYEVITQTQVLYYYNGSIIMIKERLPWEGHYFVAGNERYRVFGRKKQDLDLPISILETTVQMQSHEVNLFEAHAQLLQSILKRALRSSVIAYRADLVDEKSPVMREFIQLFRPIASNAQGSPIIPIDTVHLQELQMAIREVEQMITSLTGVTPYMLAQVGLSQTATETLTMQSMSNIKASFLQLQILYWIENVIEAFRSYLVSLPHSEQPTVSFFEQIPGESQMTEFVFGANAIPYGELLGVVKCNLTSIGFQEHLARRQEIQTLLSFIVGLYQLLVQQGAVYDVAKLVDQFIITFGFDPSEFRLQMQPPDQAQPTATENETSPIPNSMGLPTEPEPVFDTRGTPNPEYAKLNAIMGILNRVQSAMPDETPQQLERMAAAIGGLSNVT